MNEAEIDLSARMAIHAFLLEQLFANQAMLAKNPEADWEALATQLMNSIRFKTTAPGDAPELVEMHARMIAHAERFFSRVSERVSQGYR